VRKKTKTSGQGISDKSKIRPNTETDVRGSREQKEPMPPAKLVENKKLLDHYVKNAKCMGVTAKANGKVATRTLARPKWIENNQKKLVRKRARL